MAPFRHDEGTRQVTVVADLAPIVPGWLASPQYTRSTGVSVSWSDSVTSVPSPLGSSWYRQVFATALPTPTVKANSRSGSHAVIVHVVQ